MRDEEKLRDRTSKLAARGLNGIDFVLVTIPNSSEAKLEVHFFTLVDFDVIEVFLGEEHDLFPLTGGRRHPSGPEEDDVRVHSIEEINRAEKYVRLVIQPIGDYSTYTLHVGSDLDNFDPLLAHVDFKFRPGCFNTKCVHMPKKQDKAPKEPIINYLAKDFDTFKHTMITSMSQRVPEWVPSSEADLDMVLIELISAAADELSDYQDRVMNEAYFYTARKRVSLARHARLMDYHIYQGHQASTRVAFLLNPGLRFNLEPRFEFQTGGDSSSNVVFSTKEEEPYLTHLVNKLSYYTWDDVFPVLRAGSTSANLQIIDTDFDPLGAYDKIRSLILDGSITHLLIQEWKDPATGIDLEETGIRGKRQIVKLIPDEDRTAVREDPVTGARFIHVVWEEHDLLLEDFYFTTFVDGRKVENISLFHGNLVTVYHGDNKSAEFVHPDTEGSLSDDQYYYEVSERGVVCRLPDHPLAYDDVYDGQAPNGEIAPRSTLRVEVSEKQWDERITLVNSESLDSHYIVETDENGKSLVRFGNGTNGRRLPYKAIVRCEYQSAYGPDGNIGADTLTTPDERRAEQIPTCWNPLDADNGMAPELVDEILRNAPEAYRELQLRAVTVNDSVDDYELRTQMLDQVSRARASYRWMGSWRVVQVAVDPVGTTDISPRLHRQIIRHLDVVRLIGDQIIIREPKYVPLEIHVPVCIHQDYWRNDVRFLLEDEFSDGYTLDGREAFFHPDSWSFGDTVMKSQIIGRIQSIEGIDHVIDSPDPNDPDNIWKQMVIKRWNAPKISEEPMIYPDEIVQVHSNPNQMEAGFIYFHLRGGRQ